MKKLLFLLLFFPLIGRIAAQSGQFVQAPIIVQSGAISKTAKTLDEAINIAANGDLIYLPAGEFSINISINKRVHIYGVGWRSDSAATTGITRIYNDISLQPGSSGGSLNGVFVNRIIHNQFIGVLTDYRISRSRVLIIDFTNGGMPNFQMIIESSVVRYVNFYSGTLNITNTLIEERFLSSRGNNTTLNIDYCFLADRLSGARLFEGIKSINLKNSIIFQKSNTISEFWDGITWADFSNNLFVGNPSGIPNVDGFQNNIVKDITFRASVFVNYPGNNYFEERFDYHIKPTCTECAGKSIYAGPTPYFDVPENPYVTQRSVTVSPDGQKLNVNFKVSKGKP